MDDVSAMILLPGVGWTHFPGLIFEHTTWRGIETCVSGQQSRFRFRLGSHDGCDGARGWDVGIRCRGSEVAVMARGHARTRQACSRAVVPS